MDIWEASGAWTPTGDALRTSTRPLSSRNRPGCTGVTCVVRAPSISADARLNGTSSVFDMLLVGPSKDQPVSRTSHGEFLGSIGLPGEEAATFEPLVLEPYDPQPDVAVAPPSHRQPSPTPQSAPQPPASPICSVTSATNTATVSVPGSAASANGIAVPRPPPGSANQRVASGRRPACRRASSISAASLATGVSISGAATAPAPCSTEPQSEVPSSCALSIGEAQGEAGSTQMDPGCAAVSAFLAGAGIGAAAGMPSAGGANGDSRSSNGAKTAFLDPSKPAVRRLLPPLMRASEALYDTAASNAAALVASPTGADGGMDSGGALRGAGGSDTLQSAGSSGIGRGGSSGSQPWLDDAVPAAMVGLALGSSSGPAAAAGGAAATDAAPVPPLALQGFRETSGTCRGDEAPTPPLSARRAALPPMESILRASAPSVMTGLPIAGLPYACVDGSSGPDGEGLWPGNTTSVLTPRGSMDAGAGGRGGEMVFGPAAAAAAAAAAGYGSLRACSRTSTGGEPEVDSPRGSMTVPSLRAASIGVIPAHLRLDLARIRSSSFVGGGGSGGGGVLSPQGCDSGGGGGGLTSGGSLASPGRHGVDRVCRTLSMTSSRSPGSAVGGAPLPPILDRPGSARRQPSNQ